MKFTILGSYNEDAPLFRQYDGQTGPQDAFVEIDGEDRDAFASYNAEIGNAIPVYVWKNKSRRVPAPVYLRGKKVADYIKAVLEITEPAAEDFFIEWDGNNNVGRWPNWDEETDRALEKLYEEWANDETVNWDIADADEYYCYVRGELGVTAGTSDDEIVNLATNLREGAKGEGYLVQGTLEYLYGIRNDLRDDG